MNKYVFVNVKPLARYRSLAIARSVSLARAAKFKFCRSGTTLWAKIQPPNTPNRRSNNQKSKIEQFLRFRKTGFFPLKTGFFLTPHVPLSSKIKFLSSKIKELSFDIFIYKIKFLIEIISLLTRNSIQASNIKQPISYKSKENHKLFTIEINNIKNVNKECKKTNFHEE